MGKSTVNKFVIIGPARSGSTLLSTALNTHPDVCCLGELLHDKGLIRRQCHIRDFQEGATFCKDADQVYPYITKQIYVPHDGKTTVGFKMLYPHLFSPGNRFSTRVRGVFTQADDIKVIHITRDHLLESFVSYKLASITDLWNSKTPVGDRARTFRVEPIEYKKYCQDSDMYHDQIQQLVNNKEHTHLTYEQLTSDFDCEIKKILRFLDVDDTITLTPQVVKLENRPLWERVENYKQILHEMHYSPYLSRTV